MERHEKLALKVQHNLIYAAIGKVITSGTKKDMRRQAEIARTKLADLMERMGD